MFALAGIVLVAFSLRSAVASLSPLVDHIVRDFPLPAAVIGLIGTAPPVCFAVFGTLAPRIERRLGIERTTVAALAVIVLGFVARSLAVDAWTLLAATAVVFAGVGAGNVLLPPLAKKFFPDRIGVLTTAYSTVMAVASFLPPLVAVPVADALGWRFSLGEWALVSVLALLPWLALSVRARSGRPDEVETVDARLSRRLWRLPLVWALTAAFAVSSILAYTSFAWIPQLLIDRAGATPAAAGVMLSLFALMGMPTSLVVPLLAVRLGSAGVRTLFGISVASGLAAMIGLLLAPSAAPWLWIALLGLATLLFPLTLVLLGLRTRTHAATMALSGFVQSTGYAIAAVFPFGIGLLHAATGGWTLPLCVLGVVVAVALPAGLVASRDHTVEDDWARRHGTW